MSTVDTSTWNQDADLNTEIEGIPLNNNASIAQTWQAIQMLMAALKGDTSDIKLTINQPDGTTIVATNQTLTVVDNGHAHTIANVAGLQTALDGKQAAGSYAAASHTHGSITNDGKLGTASRAVVTDGNGAIDVSSVTSTELGCLSGVTSAVQTQLNGKAADSGVVHNAGAETVAGAKTFSDDMALSHAWQVSENLVSSSYTFDGTTPPYSACGILTHRDKTNAEIGNLAVYHSSGGNAFVRLAVKTMKASPETLEVRLYNDSANTYKAFQPETTNYLTLGRSGRLWKEVFCSTAAINTSDERLKSGIGSLEDELLDAWEEVSWSRFQFRDAVERKGADARIHIGLVAQRIAEVFQKHGIDPSRYGFFCHDAWQAEPEEVDADGNIVNRAQEAGDAYALRYEEALALEAACQRRRADRLEARIAALEERLNG